jgi:integrase
MEKYSVHKRPSDGRFEAKLTIDGKQKSVYGKNEEEVQRKISKLLKLSQSGEVIPGRIRLEQALLNYLTDVKLYKLKGSSYERQLCTYNNQIKGSKLSRLFIGTIKPKDITEYLFDLAKRYSESTVKKSYDLLGEFFKYQVASRNLTYNPMDLVALPNHDHYSVAEKEMDVLTTEEMKTVISVASCKKDDGTPHYRYGELIILLLLTGMRSGEARALKMDDVDIQNRRLRIDQSLSQYKDPETMKYVYSVGTPKTKKSVRYIPLSPRAIEAIQYMIKYTYNPSTGYLTTTLNGTLLSQQYIFKELDYILSKAGLPHHCIHGLRHSFATTTLKSVKDRGQIKEVSELLGHSQVSTTYDHYIGTSEDDKRNIISELDDVLLGSKKGQM